MSVYLEFIDHFQYRFLFKSFAYFLIKLVPYGWILQSPVYILDESFVGYMV